jgi:hypothetical protein
MFNNKTTKTRSQEGSGALVAGDALRLVPQRDTAAVHWRVKTGQTDWGQEPEYRIQEG